MRFFFYSNENNEPAHVRITKGDGNRKGWLEPSIEVEYFQELTFPISHTHQLNNKTGGTGIAL